MKKDLRTERIFVKVDAKYRKELEKQARKKHQSLSEYVRQAVTARMESEYETSAKAESK